LDKQTIRYYVQPVKIGISQINDAGEIKNWTHVPDVLAFRNGNQYVTAYNTLGDCGRTTMQGYVEILNFRHFADHTVFDLVDVKDKNVNRRSPNIEYSIPALSPE
jgi:hypothetical protein